MVNISKRIANLTAYPFAEIERISRELKASGVDVIDFGVGDPIDPTPVFVRESVKISVDAQAASGYPSYIGSRAFREAVGDWFEKRFKVKLDAETEITSSIGSKEAIFNFPLAYIDAGDVVLIPTPSYPPYARGTQFAGGEAYFLPLLPENNFLIDFSKIPVDVARRAKILWLNYPNSPTGMNATDDFFREAVEWCAKNNVILASDLAYSEIYFGEKPRSILEFAWSGVVEFHSLSKRSRMTGYRVGFVVGDAEIIAAFRKVKTNIDSGTPAFLQDAAVAALTDEAHVEETRKEYAEKCKILLEAFVSLGLEVRQPEATFYIWQKVPKGFTSEEFAKRLLVPEIGIVATPGSLISDVTTDGLNPGEGYVRFALVPTVEKVREAAERMRTRLRI